MIDTVPPCWSILARHWMLIRSVGRVSVICPRSALLQVLEEACKQLKIDDPTSVRLVYEKGEKPIDHSITLRLANVKAATKFAIVKSAVRRQTRTRFM
jgi:hypothetical protein